MKERPILFSSEMVLAILTGEKKQTRRVLKPQPCGYEPSQNPDKNNLWEFCCDNHFDGDDDKHHLYNCPYGAVGDRLWVRETWKPFWDDELLMTVKYNANDAVIKPDITDNNDGHKFAAMFNGEFSNASEKWRPSIFMPRWASRIMLKITNIRLHQVQDISDLDAKAEGMQPLLDNDKGLANYIAKRTGIRYKPAFSFLWDEIYMKRGYGWDDNPWVWVIEFERIKP